MAAVHPPKAANDALVMFLCGHRSSLEVMLSRVLVCFFPALHFVFFTTLGGVVDGKLVVGNVDHDGANLFPVLSFTN